MLQNLFCLFLQRNRLAEKIILQQHGASVHFAKVVRLWLNEKFGDQWIGQGGAISCGSGPFKRSNNARNSINQQTNTARRFLQIRSRLNFCISVEGNTFEWYL